MNCIICKGNYYPTEDNYNCYSTSNPPSHYFFDTNTQIFKKCSDNCKVCINEKNYCTNCDNGTKIDNDPNINHPYCQLNCQNNYYFNPDTLLCTPYCPNNYYYKDSTTHTCVNCRTLGKYYDYNNPSSGCIDNIPESYIYDTSPSGDKLKEKFGIIEKCHETCKTCSKSYDNNKCLTCNSNYFLRYDSQTCKSQCSDYSYEEDYYVKDNVQRRCINCKKENMNKPDKKIYKFSGENECINEETAKQNQNFYIINEETGTIGKCHPKCKTCFTYSNDDNNQQCETCDTENGYYILLESGARNCIKPTPEGYYIDKDAGEYKSCFSYYCKTCSGQGNEENNMCLSCKNEIKFYEPKKQCIPNCQDYGYSEYSDECLDDNCIYSNFLNSGEPKQLFYNPLLTSGNKCDASCNENKYMFENIYICLDKCSDITNHYTILNANEKL